MIEKNNERKLGAKRQIIEGDESKITGREVLLAVRRLKKKKAVGYDGIANEVWKYSGQMLFERLMLVLKKVWEGPRGLEDGSSGATT